MNFLSEPLYICIPSYKNRKQTKRLFDTFHNLGKVYLFVYDFDYVESGYDKIKFSDNVVIVKINIEKDFGKYGITKPDLPSKRKFILEYMKNLGAKYFLFSDDDTYIDEIVKCTDNNTFENVNFEYFINYVSNYMENYNKDLKNNDWNDWGIIGLHEYDNKTKKHKYNSNVIFKKRWIWGGPWIVNVEAFKRNNIDFDVGIIDDIDINFKLRESNLDIITFTNFFVKFSCRFVKNSVATNQVYDISFNTFKNWPNSCFIVYNFKEKFMFCSAQDYNDYIFKDTNKNNKTLNRLLKCKDVYELMSMLDEVNKNKPEDVKLCSNTNASYISFFFNNIKKSTELLDLW